MLIHNDENGVESMYVAHACAMSFVQHVCHAMTLLSYFVYVMSSLSSCHSCHHVIIYISCDMSCHMTSAAAARAAKRAKTEPTETDEHAPITSDLSIAQPEGTP